MNNNGTERRSELNMISLVDVVFLLLIFTFAIVGYVSHDGIGPHSQDFTISITSWNIEDRGNAFRVTISSPAYPSDSSETYFCDSTFWRLSPEAIDRLPASRLIAQGVADFCSHRRTTTEKGAIRLLADRRTPFKLAGYIIRTCSNNGEFSLNYGIVPSSEGQ